MNRRNEAELEQRMRNLGQLESRVKARDARDRNLLRSFSVPRLTKQQRERVLLLRKVNRQDAGLYGEFLQADKTGIFRLFPNFDCVTPNAIRIDGNCSEFVPESSAFSFRTGNYSDSIYHDMAINHGEIFSRAFFSQGIFVSLGDMPLEQATLTHPGLKQLADLLPESEITGAKEAASRFEAGHQAVGFTYSDRVKPIENTTYALRIIAYKCSNSFPPPSPESSISELKFLSLAFDKRADLIVAFRIVRKDADGNFTILWKELLRKDAPRIKFTKEEVRADFKSEPGSKN